MIARDATANGSNSYQASDLQWSHTISGTDTGLLVGVVVSNDAGAASDWNDSVTFNGVPLTLWKKQQSTTNGEWLYIWQLAGPAVGTYTVDVHITHTSQTRIFASSASYLSSYQASPDSSNGVDGGGGGGELSLATTVVAANCWLFMVSAVRSGGGTVSAGSGTTKLQPSSANYYAIFDSNGTVGTGSHSLKMDYTSDQPFDGAIVSFKPGTAPPSSLPASVLLDLI